MNAIQSQPAQKAAILSPDISTAIQKWGNSIWRPTVPTNLLTKSTVTAVIDERAKVLTAQFLYGERNGTEKEIPYKDGEIRNRTDNLSQESLWLYGGGPDEAPKGFSEGKQDKFTIQTGKTHKCPRCKGDGKVDCFICKGTGRRDTDKSKDCQHCNGSGKTRCGTCKGYRYVEVVIEVKTRFKVEEAKDHDYQGEIPPKKIEATTGTIIFEEVANYPENDTKEMLRGGIDREEYVKLQMGIATVFHTLIIKKLETYDGDKKLVHGLLNNFIGRIPNAFKENRVLEHEILPVRMKIKVEDVPVRKVSYTYKNKPYSLWVYGKEKKIYARKRPLALTGRLVFQWIVQLALVGLVIYWVSGRNAGHPSDRHPLAEAPASVTPARADSLEDTRKAAEQGSADAQTRLGVMYAKGQGVTKDPAEALKWFTKAADQGFARAENNLGAIYYNGNGVTKDFTAAVAWFTKAADQGNADAQNNLGSMYGDGEGVAKDPAQAVLWFRRAADQGNALAQNNLALAYAKGEGVPKDPAEAVKWFSKAADKGLARAQNNLGVMCDDGNGTPKDSGEAVKWFRKAAEQGFPRAQNNLGEKYLSGDGVAKDPAEAARWFEKAAEHGHAVSQFHLAIMYSKGQGLTNDPAQAIKWMAKAAEQGQPNAQNSLAAMYCRGEGTAKDPAEAAKWFAKAAEQGFAEAQYNLGQMYNAGTGVPMDYVQAAKWFNLAALQGDADAKKAYSKLAEIMTPEKISQAQALAKAFVPKAAAE